VCTPAAKVLLTSRENKTVLEFCCA
jgi:hypothetical protein